MKRFLAALAILCVACSGQSAAPQSSRDREPDMSERGIEIDPVGLAEMIGTVAGRSDAACREPFDGARLCLIKHGAEAWIYTLEEHPAHGAVLFRGLVERNGKVIYVERGWFSGEETRARSFFEDAARIVPILTWEPPDV